MKRRNKNVKSKTTWRCVIGLTILLFGKSTMDVKILGMKYSKGNLNGTKWYVQYLAYHLCTEKWYWSLSMIKFGSINTIQMNKLQKLQNSLLGKFGNMTGATSEVDLGVCLCFQFIFFFWEKIFDNCCLISKRTFWTAGAMPFRKIRENKECPI